jgi:hypothetical protein
VDILLLVGFLEPRNQGVTEYIDAARAAFGRRASSIQPFDEWPRGVSIVVYFVSEPRRSQATRFVSDSAQGRLVVEHDVVTPTGDLDDFDVVEIMKRGWPGLQEALTRYLTRKRCDVSRMQELVAAIGLP